MAAVSRVSRLINLGAFDLKDDSVMDDIRRAKLAAMRLAQPRRDELFSIEVLPSQACMAYRLTGFADLERLQGAYRLPDARAIGVFERTVVLVDYGDTSDILKGDSAAP